MTHQTNTSLLKIAVVAMAMSTPSAQFALADEAALDVIHQKIVRKYSSVQHMTSDVLTRNLADPAKAGDYVLFDVRELDEHRVSHLKNATQIEPGIWTSTFMRKHGERIKGKTVVFYCSVGRRSSYAASYLQDTLKKNGAKQVVNLKGGIFSWHNQKRELSDGATQTPFVHPYNTYWGRLIERRALTSFKPQSSPLPDNAGATAFSPIPSSVATQTSQ